MKPRGMNIGTGELLPPALVGVMILLDRSASMRAIKAPMQAAFQAFVDEQRAASPDGMWLSLHQFDDIEYERAYDKKPLADVEALDLRPRGNTPLRDALFDFGTAARAIIDDATDETDRLLLVIITDGEENASKVHTWPEVRVLFDGLETAECEVIWLGTDAAILEAEEVMPMMAQPGGTINFTHDAVGVAYAAGGMSASVTGARMGASSRSVSDSYVHSADPETYKKNLHERLRDFKAQKAQDS